MPRSLGCARSLLLLGLLLLGAASGRPACARLANFAITYRFIPAGHEQDANELPFWASHYDLLISPQAKYLAALESLAPSQLRIVYVNYYCLYVGGDMYQALASYCQAHRLPLESMFVHYAEPTTVAYEGETHVLPAGSRVATYGWYKTGGDLTKAGARVVVHPGNPDFRRFLASFLVSQVTLPYNGVSYDGVFVDNTGPHMLTEHNGLKSGGQVTEYPGDAAARDAAYSADLVKCFAEAQTALRRVDKIQVANVATYGWNGVYPYVWGVLREGELNSHTETATMESHIARYLEANQAGARNLAHPGAIKTEADRVSALAVYLIVGYAPGNSYYGQTTSYAGPLDQDQWSPLLEFDPGAPVGPYFVFAQGIDPTSPVHFEGACQMVKPGPLFVFQDASQHWAPNALKNLPFIDAAGHSYPVYANTADTISVWAEKKPAPVAGAYSVGSYRYRILAREFTHALVLWKGRSAGTSNTSAATATTHPLPVTAGAPTGAYAPLDAANRQGAPVTSITLQNTDGVILVKSGKGSQAGLTLTLSACPEPAASGQEVTYTLTYTNTGSLPALGVVLSAPIPANTEYLAGSATAGGTLRGKAVIWPLGEVPGGRQGSVSYRVRVR